MAFSGNLFLDYFGKFLLLILYFYFIFYGMLFIFGTVCFFFPSRNSTISKFSGIFQILEQFQYFIFFKYTCILACYTVCVLKDFLYISAYLSITFFSITFDKKYFFFLTIVY